MGTKFRIVLLVLGFGHLIRRGVVATASRESAPDSGVTNHGRDFEPVALGG